MTAPGKPVRVLLVDDNEDFLHSARDWLAGRSLEVVGVARSGTEALEAVDRLAPDLVLMDAVMTGMTGFEATRRIKERDDAPRVVILTFHESQAARLEAWVAGADEFIAKAQFTDEFGPVLNELFGTDAKTDRRRPEAPSRRRPRDAS